MPTNRVSGAQARPGVLVLARHYPHQALPLTGLWTERMVEASRDVVEPVVVSPVGYVPPGVPIEALSRLRDVPSRETRNHIDVHRPRMPIPPGYLLHRYEARLAYPFVRRAMDRLVEERQISLIHAHFVYPEGVVAARLGRRYGLPVVTTEHAMWLPWMEHHPAVRTQVLEALGDIAMVTVVSKALGRTVRAVAGENVTIRHLPNLVQETVFTPPDSDAGRDPNRVLFVGAVRHVKGLDVLVRALPHLLEARPEAHLVVVGDPFFRQYRKDQEKVRRLIREMGLESKVRFYGGASPAEVAEQMRQSAVLAVPSRREAFSAVILEALATGTPVVATRCGGPEESVEESVGRLVPVEDPPALARALEEVMATPQAFPRSHLRAYCVSRWGRGVTVDRLRRIYEDVLSVRRGSGA